MTILIECSGGNHSARIADAFDALPADGGKITLGIGDFQLTETLQLPSKPVALVGQGEATVLNFDLTSTGDCVSFSGDADPQGIAHLAISGDDTDTRYGVLFPANAAFKRLEVVYITDVTSAGVRGDNTNSQNYLRRVWCQDLDEGFTMYGHANLYHQCIAKRSATLGLGGNWGFRSQEVGSTYVDCIAEKFTAGFQVVSYADSVSYHGCYAEACSWSLAIDGNPAPIGTCVYGFYSYNAAHATNAAIIIGQSEATLLSGLNVVGSTSNKSLSIAANTKTLIVRGGRLDDTTPYSYASGCTARIEDVSAAGQWLDWSST